MAESGRVSSSVIVNKKSKPSRVAGPLSTSVDRQLGSPEVGWWERKAVPTLREAWAAGRG